MKKLDNLIKFLEENKINKENIEEKIEILDKYLTKKKLQIIEIYPGQYQIRKYKTEIIIAYMINFNRKWEYKEQ